MADRQTYLENNDDQISAQIRQERRRTGGALLTTTKVVAGIATFMIARRKLNLARSFSNEIKSLGSAGKQFSRYEITSLLKDKNANPISRIIREFKNIGEGLARPIPTAAEQRDIALATFKRHGLKIKDIPGELENAVTGWSRWNTFLHGPIKAIAPHTPITLPGKSLSSGEFGGISAAGKLFRFSKTGKVDQIVTGVRSGLAGTMGERTESLRAFGHVVDDVTDIKSFTRKVLAPSSGEVILEHKRIFAENYLRTLGASLDVAENEPTTRDVVRRLSAQIDHLAKNSAPGTKNSRAFFQSRKEELRRSYREAMDRIVNEQARKKSTKLSYGSYKFGRKIGFGEQFAKAGEGEVQKFWKKTREVLGMGIKDPISGRSYRVAHRKYFSEAQSITGAWKTGEVGTAWMYPAGGTLKRTASDFIEGTFFKQIERLTGMGITVRPNWMTKFVSHVVGAQEGSYGDYFIRRYLGGFYRLGLLGAGAAVTFKTIDYLARQTTGWGVTDVAGKVYTSSREFQQHVLDALGVVDASKKLEHAFPGLINSPIARLARVTAPAWMMSLGARHGGRKGGLIGLSLGIATALLTWGDITQSPEELHRIYTGEQEIPIRKGRYWMFGKTPFGGGKIMYYRPHWYPLLRSKYKYQGQLWDSETERLAQGTFLSPILAPLLTGHAWDPYYWEKKHYYDRPYPVTGELFEPTMPFAWLGNMTIGKIIKPQRIMHPEYYGVPQKEQGASKTIVPGAAGQLGMMPPEQGQLLPVNQPDSFGWKTSEAAYTWAEHAGLRGWLVGALAEKFTGQPYFLPKGAIAQSASRGYGLERAYWDLNIGDPGETTEFLRRVIPHRRRGVEEYNPIPNQMPSWLPGEDYFINFRQGDPYTKVEMGEARLPGAGYESLHKLHSGIPNVYDAIDRFMILADIAPYSKEYSHYKYLAIAMSKKEPSWQERVNRKIDQRAKTQEEFQFLSLTPPEDIKGPLRAASRVYRHAAAGISSVGELVDPFAGFLVMSPTSKFFPYKTARQAYKAYRLQGSEFTDWANPMRDFIGPDAEKAKEAVKRAFGETHISSQEKERREYEEYFDRLQYIKFKKLEQMAMDTDNAQLAKKFRAMSRRTMTGVNADVDISRIMGSLPKRERAFFGEFSKSEGKERDEILKLVSPQMARIYEAQWAMRDGGDRARNVDRYNADMETAEYFKTHNVPNADWAGWNPEVDIKDVQLKTVKNEGMNIHNFDLWESQQRAMERRPNVPAIENIRDNTNSIENLRRIMSSQLQNDGYNNTRIYVTRTPAKYDSVNLRIKVKKDRSREVESNMREMINA